MLFSTMFVMHLMSFSNSFKIRVIGISQNLKPLVDKDIVDKEIGHPVKQNAQSYEKPKVVSCLCSKQDEQKAGNCIDQKENIVSFEKTRLLHVVIFVKFPHESVHHIFVSEPGHELHGKESCDY